MLDKATLDVLAAMMYLQERLEELRKGDQQVYYDNKTTPIQNDRGICPPSSDTEANLEITINPACLVGDSISNPSVLNSIISPNA